MTDDLDQLPTFARRAVQELRRLEPPPGLLEAVVREASGTGQRRPWRSAGRGVMALIGAAAAIAVAVFVAPRLHLPGPGATSSGTPSQVDLRLELPAGAEPTSADARRVWLANPTTGRVTRVDAAAGAVTGEVDVNAPSKEPYSFWPVSDGTSVWVAGAADRSVVRIDAESLRVRSRWPIDAVPYRVAPAGDVVWISDFDASRVLELDASTGAVRGTVDVQRPTGIAVTSEAVYVVGYAGTLVVIDPSTRAVTGRHLIASGATDVVAVDGGLLIWGINGRDLERFDIERGTVIASLQGVTGVATLHGNVWVAIQGGSVSQVDATRLNPAATIPLGEVMTDQLVASSDRLWAFAGTNGGAFLYSVRPGP